MTLPFFIRLLNSLIRRVRKLLKAEKVAEEGDMKFKHTLKCGCGAELVFYDYRDNTVDFFDVSPEYLKTIYLECHQCHKKHQVDLYVN